MTRRARRLEPPKCYGVWPDGPFATDRIGRAAAAAGSVAAEIIERRSVLGWSRQQLADVTGLTPQTLFNLERGETWPDFVTLATLADALGVDLRVPTLSAAPALPPPRPHEWSRMGERKAMMHALEAAPDRAARLEDWA